MAGAKVRDAFDHDASDTLVTRVLLGVFGCVRAVDIYFSVGWKFVTGHGTERINKRNILKLSEFHEANEKEIEDCRIPTLQFRSGPATEIKYTRAKVIDMFFFNLGRTSSS